ncbi:hypothetical protein [Thermomonospora amylolytica]|uniref:hypothetical protein n=1 Tax=Thermomonospora amylolytica TaxID=1411117 RepID=UPI000E6CC007|nr:hypothetical protein [Thermomonospora amylolytica]
MRTALRYYHLAMTILWIALIPPALIWWRESIIFVIILSLYANIEASFGAYQAARAEAEEAED